MADIHFQNVTKRFGSFVALDELSLSIKDRSLVCLLGPSGCGKTTSLRMLAGFLVPDSGEISIGNRVLASAGKALPPEKRNMSMIFQSYALWPHMTIADNVGFGLVQRKVEKHEIARRVKEALSLVRLGHIAERYPTELSGGQQQRIALARALAVSPETMLADEPLSNLDANLREEMRFEIRRLHEHYGLTTVYVTHDQAEALATADHVVVMNQGKIEQSGSPEEVYTAPRSRFVAKFIGGANVLEGRRVSDGVIVFGDTHIRCSSGETSAQQDVAVAIRTHDVKLSKGGEVVGTDGNVISGQVIKHSYLGSARDYLVELKGGTQIRVMAPENQVFDPGGDVVVRFPVEHCRVLAA